MVALIIRDICFSPFYIHEFLQLQWKNLNNSYTKSLRKTLKVTQNNLQHQKE